MHSVNSFHNKLVTMRVSCPHWASSTSTLESRDWAQLLLLCASCSVIFLPSLPVALKMLHISFCGLY